MHEYLLTFSQPNNSSFDICDPEIYCPSICCSDNYPPPTLESSNLYYECTKRFAQRRKNKRQLTGLFDTKDTLKPEIEPEMRTIFRGKIDKQEISLSV